MTAPAPESVTFAIDLAQPSRLREHVNQEVAVSDWIEVSQDRIGLFAEATDDHQWIHVDAARAERESPFKTTIAHGFLTLSLLSILARRSITFTGLRMAVNYGLNRVRFVSPVPAAARVRGRFTLVSVEDIGGGYQVVWQVTIERAGSEKPCVVAEWVTRYYADAA